MMDEMVAELEIVAELAAEKSIAGYPNLQNKWLARSAFQKAIRRGRTEEALLCGANLAASDPDGAWRALATIIVEDVGFGDLDLLSYSTIAPLKTVRKMLKSPARLFMGMVIRACASVKTRSACELSLGADKDPDVPWAHLLGLDDEALLAMMHDPKLSTQYAATVLVRRRCGKDKSGGLMNKALTLIMDKLGPGMRGRAAMMSFERQVDTMNSAIWPLLSWELDIDFANVEEDLFPPEMQIAGVSCCALDMHTLQGKKAIKAFHTSLVNKGNEVMKELAAKSDDVVKGLGSIIFIVEGGQLDRRITSGVLWSLKDYQDRNFSAAWGCPPELFNAVKKTVLENFELLNSKRQWAVGI